MQQQSRSSIWQPLIYLIMIGFTFIVMPRTGTTYQLARCVQGIEILFFIALLIQFCRDSFGINKLNWRINLWWLLYTIITYAFIQGSVGLTPLFKWLNIIIFLLCGVCYWQQDPINSYKHISTVPAHS